VLIISPGAYSKVNEKFLFCHTHFLYRRWQSHGLAVLRPLPFGQMPGTPFFSLLPSAGKDFLSLCGEDYTSFLFSVVYSVVILLSFNGHSVVSCWC